MKPAISIIIPLYNKELSIHQTLSSIYNQTFTDFELVIVDDGSTDKSVEKVEEFMNSRGLTNIRIIKQKNAGPGAARNTGSKNAKADWIVFIDADDELLPDALEHFCNIINSHREVDIIDCNKYNRTGNEQVLGYHPIEGYITNPLMACYFGKIMPGCGQSVFKTSFILEHLYDERIRRFEDAELLIRQLSVAKVYSSKHPTMIHDNNFAEASKPRKDVREDYFSYLDLNTGSFWRKMCVYRTFLEERELYPEVGHNLYPSWYYRYDMLLLFKLLNLLKPLF